VLAPFAGAVLFEHGALEQLADLLGLAFEHGGLVGHPHVFQIPVGVKARRAGLAELAHEFVLVAAVENVVGNVAGFVVVEHDQVLVGKRAGGDGLLVLVLAVDDGGKLAFFVLLDRVPNLGDPGTGGIDDGAALVVEQLHLLHARAKGRKDHHIARVNDREILLAVPNGNEAHLHIPQLLVDAGVVDDFVGDPNALVGKMLAAFVSDRHSPLDSPAKAECLGEADGNVAARQPIAVVANFADELALVLRLHGIGDFGFIAEAPAVVVGRVLKRALERFGIHGPLLAGLPRRWLCSQWCHSGRAAQT